MKKYLGLWLSMVLLAMPVNGDDDTWHNMYHTLRRFGHSVKDTFTGDDESSSAHTTKATSRHSVKHRQNATRKKHPESESAGSQKSIPEKDKSKDLKPSASPAAAEPTPTGPPRETPAAGPSPGAQASPNGSAEVASLTPSELREFDRQPAKVQEMLRDALSLTERNLNYKYGSADPSEGGMDCSGFIYYVLSNSGFKEVPRDSSQQYLWVRKNSDFHAVLSRSSDTFELDDLRPGDLMFWSGTYKVDRDVPITHVMIYLGREKDSGKRVMVGATDGRTYEGKQRYGVSVFDFKLPNVKPNKNDPDMTAKFEGYASVPGL
jgi:cell wall-associated NlpC family hydrolase